MMSLAERFLSAFKRNSEQSYEYACIRGVFKVIRPSERDKVIVVEPEDVVMHDIFNLFDGEICETGCVRFLEDGELPRELFRYFQNQIIVKGKCVVFLVDPSSFDTDEPQSACILYDAVGQNDTTIDLTEENPVCL